MKKKPKPKKKVIMPGQPPIETQLKLIDLTIDKIAEHIDVLCTERQRLNELWIKMESDSKLEIKARKVRELI